MIGLPFDTFFRYIVSNPKATLKSKQKLDKRRLWWASQFNFSFQPIAGQPGKEKDMCATNTMGLTILKLFVILGKCGRTQRNKLDKKNCQNKMHENFKCNPFEMAGSARNAQIIAPTNGHFCNKRTQGRVLFANPFRMRLSACKLKVQILTFKTMCQAHLWLFCRHVLAATQSAGLVRQNRTKTDANRTTAADKDVNGLMAHVCISCALLVSGQNFN